MEIEGLDIVEGLAHSETEEEPTCSFSVRRAGNVGALATLGSFGPTVQKEKRDDRCAPGQTGTLRREQQERLERSHGRRNQATCRKVRCHKLRHRKGKHSDTLIGYSGRAALRREQCDK
jgi:hypothetical protein